MRQKIIHSLPRPKEFLEGFDLSTQKTYGSAMNLFNKFLLKEYGYNYDNILDVIKNNEVDVYEVFRKFTHHIKSLVKPKSIRIYNTAIRSYLDYYDIEINQRKFKRKVKPPRVVKQEAYPLSKHQIIEILRHCHNKRLRPYLFVLASAATREKEVLAVRKKDINFETRPTTIKLRGNLLKQRLIDIFSLLTKPRKN